ncbi:phosphotransferase family protein [Streptomyces sp. NPDC057499]|uniref:phosphotransferase family protein n=1 Tax=Streptomyces sp. NPDC057499 TaxID=3346150 RepID=UPI00367F75D5
MAAAPGTPRIRRTTRDPEELARRLAAWLATVRPGARPAAVTVPDSNGMSSETLLFDIEETGQGTPSAPLPVRRCVLRLAADPNAYTVFPSYDMTRQFRVMRLVAAHTDLPVPAVHWLETDPAHLGAEFFVMERVEGRVPPDAMPYTYAGNWLHSATDAERARLEHASISVLARLHDQAPVPEAGFLAGKGSGSPLRRHVEDLRAYYGWVVEGRPRSPVVEAAFTRLEELWPAEEGETVLSWGDARIGNIIYDGFEPAAVLDWEMAALGPRELDLAWAIYLHRFFHDLTVALGQEGLPDFFRRTAAEEQYARLTGYTPRDMDFHTLYACLRHAIVMLRVGYRQIHFGEVPPPADPDDLVMNRAALKAMTEGHY